MGVKQIPYSYNESRTNYAYWGMIMVSNKYHIVIMRVEQTMPTGG